MVTVLLVDDSNYIRDMLRMILSGAGHDVVGEAASADEAIEKFQKLQPDMVLIDIVLEAGNKAKTGIDALKEILKFEPQANVIICSGLDEQTLINESMRIGAKAFVTKPIDPEKLLETVITCSDLSIIAEIGNIGAGRAATVLSKLAKQPIQINLPKLETGPPHLITRRDGAPERPVTAIQMRLQGKNDCDVLIAFELSEAAKISKIMTEKYPLKDSSDIELSAIKEMGSNTICALFGAIADFTELSLIPSAPTLVTDSFEAIVDVFLAKMAIAAKTALIFQISLKKQTSQADGVIIIIPSHEFQDQLINAGKRWISTEAQTPMLVA